MKLFNYNKGYRIVSIALNTQVKEDLSNSGLDFLYISEEGIFLYPDEELIDNHKALIEELRGNCNYNVYEIWPNGRMVCCYQDDSTDNYFLLTGKCNSNCVMCPSPGTSRKEGNHANIVDLITIAKHIPVDTSHLTLTGGEPFMLGESVFQFIGYLKEKFETTEFLILTNGRIFAVESYAIALKECIPNNCIVGIPIHGSNAELHDSITQTENSFIQTMIGIKRLLKLHIRVELRILVTKINATDCYKLAEMIIQEIPDVEHVSIMAMEMTGDAYVNREKVWIPYKDAFAAVSEAIKLLIKNGIDIKLFNFPLCSVKREYWTLCEKSISARKVRYAEVCDMCHVKKACGGVFAGTFMLERNELKAQV